MRCAIISAVFTFGLNKSDGDRRHVGTSGGERQNENVCCFVGKDRDEKAKASLIMCSIISIKVLTL